LKADRREHEPRAGGESDLAPAHRLKAQIGLANTGLGPLAALERTDHNRGQGPGELRLPDEVDVAELRPDAEIVATAARPQLAETGHGAVVNRVRLKLSRRRWCYAAQSAGSHEHAAAGRGERIRTSGPCLPKTVLYQAELLPDRNPPQATRSRREPRPRLDRR